MSCHEDKPAKMLNNKQDSKRAVIIKRCALLTLTLAIFHLEVGPSKGEILAGGWHLMNTNNAGCLKKRTVNLSFFILTFE